jgi:hypothetical protein
MQKAKAAAQGHFFGADPQVQGLRDEQIRAVEPARALAAENLNLERTLSDLVSQAYGLTPAEINLIWKTAPPRMSIPPPAI